MPVEELRPIDSHKSNKPNPKHKQKNPKKTSKSQISVPTKQTGKMQKRNKEYSFFNWQEVPNYVKNIPFTSTPGLCTDVTETLETNCKELDLFTLFCGDEFFEMIARETNAYAIQEINRA